MDIWILRVLDIRPEASDTATIFLERVDGRPIIYQAGQFLTLLFQSHGREIRRSYSFSTTPGIDPVPAITVKKMVNGEISRFLLHRMEPGHELAALPAAGRFLLPDMADGRTPGTLVFITAGSGMVPVFSLLKQALLTENYPGVILISQQHDSGSIPFRAILEQWAQDKRITWVNWRSTDEGHLNNGSLAAWIGALVPEADWPGIWSYLCGPPAFMRMAQFTLKLMGMSDQRIRMEHFTVEYVPPPPPLHDTSPKMVSIEIGGRSHRFEAVWPDSILAAAERHHIRLPYSCRGGRCSTCTARCLDGKVRMSINKVLTEKDLGEGLVLTCVGYAETDIRLQL